MTYQQQVEICPGLRVRHHIYFPFGSSRNILKEVHFPQWNYRDANASWYASTFHQSSPLWVGYYNALRSSGRRRLPPLLNSQDCTDNSLLHNAVCIFSVKYTQKRLKNLIVLGLSGSLKLKCSPDSLTHAKGRWIRSQFHSIGTVVHDWIIAPLLPSTK